MPPIHDHAISIQSTDIIYPILTHITRLNIIIETLDFLLDGKNKILRDLMKNQLCESSYLQEFQHATSTLHHLSNLPHNNGILTIAIKMLEDELSAHEYLIDLLAPGSPKNMDDISIILYDGIDRNQEYVMELRKHVDSVQQALNIVSLSNVQFESWSQQFDWFHSLTEEDKADGDLDIV